ncbi:hypothetical protein [Winogradskyella sp.]|uniref:hypothetical protein n=1 Tax=Winogradskyella sp. TaxID=1883156 RepID=UPI00345D9826
MGKYFKYAIGEIILVVIGILIALQINNWNEHRNQQNILNNIYATIKVDLEEDIRSINKVITTNEDLEKIYWGIINKKIEKEDFKNCEDCWQINMSYSDFKLHRNGIDLLLDYNKNHDTSKDSLAIKLKNLYNDLGHNIEVSIAELKEEIGNYNTSIINNAPWFTDVVNGKYSEEFVEYAFTNVRYRNTATIVHFFTYEKYLPSLKSYKEKSLELIDAINDYLETK